MLPTYIGTTGDTVPHRTLNTPFKCLPARNTLICGGVDAILLGSTFHTAPSIVRHCIAACIITLYAYCTSDIRLASDTLGNGLPTSLALLICVEVCILRAFSTLRRALQIVLGEITNIVEINKAVFTLSGPIISDLTSGTFVHCLPTAHTFILSLLEIGLLTTRYTFMAL